MRGISEVRLKQIAHETHDSDDTNLPVLSLLDLLISECQELNPWIPLEEFFKSGFVGLCWVAVRSGSVYPVMRIGSKFIDDLQLGTHIYQVNITHVMPIHKPEPPR